MTAPLLTFTPGSGVPVDLDRLIASRMLIQANSGGGKSWALRYLLEQTHGRVQHIVIDPEGEFFTLREKFDYVLAGRDGDIPADPKTAKLLCRRLMEIGASAVIDLYDLKLHERRAFVRLFLEELMHLPRALWHGTLIVIDEAHTFAPEKGHGDSEALEAVISLATQGRKRGYALVAATQRLSKLNKDVAAETLNKLIGRTGLDVDLKRAGDELGMNKDDRRGLMTLGEGEFYVYGPAIANAVTLVRTGAVRTSHPKAGALASPPPPAPAAVAGLLAQLKDIPQAAEEELRALEDFKRKNAALERELRQLRANGNERVVEKPVEKIVEVPDFALVARAVGDHERVRSEHLIEIRGMLTKVIDRLTFTPDAPAWEAKASIARSAQHQGGRVPARVESGAVSAPAPRRALAQQREMDSTDARLSGPMQGVVNALAEMERLGVAPAPRSTVAGLVGYHERAKSFVNALGALRSRGAIEYPPNAPGMIELTDDGRALATTDLTFRTLDELHAHWYARMKGPERRIAEVLVREYPDSITRESLAEMIGYHPRAKSLVNALGRLRTAGVIDYPTSGMVGATDVLFPQGLT